MSDIINAPRFIVVEGMDGSGKTTIVDHLCEYIRDKKLWVSKGRGLGTTPVAEGIRSQMFSKKPSSNYEIFGAMMCLIDCHENFVKNRIENTEDVIVLDRYIPSYFAYQVMGRESKIAETMFNELLSGFYKPVPDIYIYIEVDLDVALNRTKQRNDSNYLDEEVISYRQRVYEGYKTFFNIASWQEKKPDSKTKVIRLDGNQELNKVLEQLKSELDKHFI